MPPEVFLFGAGASVDAGVPATYDMTRRIKTKFSGDSEVKAVLDFVIGGLAFQRGVTGKDPEGGFDIEEVFNAVELLANRDALPIRSFIGAWHPHIEELSRPPVRTQRVSLDVVSLIRNIVKPPQGLSSPHTQHLVRGYAMQLYTLLRGQTSTRVFADACAAMIRSVSEIAWVADARSVAYLEPICERARDGQGVVIATLNYDNAVELAAKSAYVSCTTGIARWSEVGRVDDAVGRGVLLLLKLHGSVDWSLTNDEANDRRPLPHRTVRQADGPVTDGDGPAIIFGQGNKLTVEGPFLELLRRFQEELAGTANLNIIGYSFRDAHVNALLTQWLNASPEHKIRIIDPGIKNTSELFAQKLRALPGRVQVIDAQAKEGRAFWHSILGPLA